MCDLSLKGFNYDELKYEEWSRGLSKIRVERHEDEGCRDKGKVRVARICASNRVRVRTWVRNRI